MRLPSRYFSTCDIYPGRTMMPCLRSEMNTSCASETWRSLSHCIGQCLVNQNGVSSSIMCEKESERTMNMPPVGILHSARSFIYFSKE